MLETTLADFAAYGAERIAAELDQTFVAYLLTEIGVARDAHYRWASAPDRPTDRPETRYPLPEGTVPAYFSLSDTGLIVHGPDVDAYTRRWIVGEIERHLPGYLPPAPYVVLRGTDAQAVVYRMDDPFDGSNVYGLVFDFAAPTGVYRSIVERTEMLPRSVGDENVDLVAASIHLAPDTPALFDGGSSGDIDGPEAWAFAAKAGRLAVRTRMDGSRGRALVVGAAGGTSLPLLSVLALLTAALLYSAIVLLRRSVRLAALRESFVANVSHDLRTPIAQIRMFAESLRLGRLADEADRRRALEIVHRQTEVLEDLVDNLLEASGRGASIDPVPTDLEGLASDVVDGLAPTVEASDCSVTVTADGAREAVVDPMATTRILTNLVENAVRHGRRGGRIDVSIGAEEGWVTLTVDDDGPGIRPQDRERVFDRFERRPTPGSAATGAGIGLSVVRGLAERHGGSAEIEASPTGGTRVVVRLRDGGAAA